MALPQDPSTEPWIHAGQAIKMGVIRLPALFELLEAHPERVMGLDPELIEQATRQPTS